jgi:membrane-associated phospholipid phosphatase
LEPYSEQGSATATPSRAPEVPLRPRASFFAALAAAIVIAHLLDGWVYTHFRVENVYGADWGRALRVMGFLPLWLVAALALALHDRDTRGYYRGALLAGSATLGGIAAELLKLVLRRLRPAAQDGEYAFRAFSDRPFSTGGLALPSSHALVAFGAAAMLSRLFPAARIVWWGVAWGCALTRVASGAHFLSDVVVAAIVGWLVAWLLWRRFPSRLPGA